MKEEKKRKKIRIGNIEDISSENCRFESRQLILRVLEVQRMDAAAELGRMEMSRLDAGRDCRTRLARPNSHARTRTGKCTFSLFSWPRSRIGNLTRLILTRTTCDDHTEYGVFA